MEQSGQISAGERNGNKRRQPHVCNRQQSGQPPLCSQGITVASIMERLADGGHRMEFRKAHRHLCQSGIVHRQQQHKDTRRQRSRICRTLAALRKSDGHDRPALRAHGQPLLRQRKEDERAEPHIQQHIPIGHGVVPTKQRKSKAQLCAQDFASGLQPAQQQRAVYQPIYLSVGQPLPEACVSRLRVAACQLPLADGDD